MSSFFLNPWMLAGLAGICLPILVHLLVRRRYDVVDWGAMQFLQPGLRTRRRLQLQDLLLLFIRIALIAIPALALARPWISAGLFSGYESAGSRDVVLVIDSSISMGRPDGISTVHQTALRRADRYLDSLKEDDTAMLIDARDVPRVLVSSPINEMAVVRSQLDALEGPAGYGNLIAACQRAVSLLAQASHQHRDIVIFTDAQRCGWLTEDDESWKQWNALRSVGPIKPRVWVLDCADHLGPSQNTVTVGRLQVRPENPVPDTTVEVTTTIHSHAAADRNVTIDLQQNGQTIAEHHASLTLPAGSVTQRKFVLSPNSPGPHQITLRVDDPEDEIQADNQAHAVVFVRPPLDVMLLRAATREGESSRSCLFLETALAATEESASLVRLTLADNTELTATALQESDVVILCGLEGLPADATGWLVDAVEAGVGLLVIPDSYTTAAEFDRVLDRQLTPGVKLTEVQRVDPDAAVPVRIQAASLHEDWLQPFQERTDSSFLNTVFRQWWVCQIDSGDSMRSLIQLTNHVPLLLDHRHGRGRVLMLTSAMDNRWNTLPGRPDFVTFIYETVFALASSRADRNLMPGMPFSVSVPDGVRDNYVVRRPFGKTDVARVRLTDRGAPGQRQLYYSSTVVPGVYQLQQHDQGRWHDGFSVDYDRKEDDPEHWNAADLERLQEAGIQVMPTLRDLQRAMYSDESATELWFILLLGFLALLVVESRVTHHLVLSRHGATPNRNCVNVVNVDA